MPNRLLTSLTCLFFVLVSCGEDQDGSSGTSGSVPSPFRDPATVAWYRDSEAVFDDTKVHTVEITIRQDYLVDMVARAGNGIRHDDRRFMPAHVAIDGDPIIENCGLRVRGNINTGKAKKSYKLQFNERNLYVGSDQYTEFPGNRGRRYRGLKNLNLRAATTDRAFIHDKAGYWLYHQLGYPAPRVTWAKVFITETDASGIIVMEKQYKGLYLLTEDLDETFVQTRFKLGYGNLYKVTRNMGSLHDVFPDIRDLVYGDGTESPRVYKLETNKERDDYSDLNAFLHTLNHDWANIDKKLDFSLLARFFALNNAQGNWDEYIFIQNNYYFYFDPGFGFVMLPWDIENNFDMGNPEWGFPSFIEAPLLAGLNSHWNGPHDVPLWNQAVTDSRFTNTYLSNMRVVAAAMGPLAQKVQEWTALIEADATAPYRTVNYGGDLATPGEHGSAAVSAAAFAAERERVLGFLAGRAAFIAPTADELTLRIVSGATQSGSGTWYPLIMKPLTIEAGARSAHGIRGVLFQWKFSTWGSWYPLEHDTVPPYRMDVWFGGCDLFELRAVATNGRGEAMFSSPSDSLYPITDLYQSPTHIAGNTWTFWVNPTDTGLNAEGMDIYLAGEMNGWGNSTYADNPLRFTNATIGNGMRCLTVGGITSGMQYKLNVNYHASSFRSNSHWRLDPANPIFHNDGGNLNSVVP